LANFCGQIHFQKWPFLVKFGHFAHFCFIDGQKFSKKCELWSKKVTKWPFLKTKVATLKRNKIGPLRVLWSNAHFYFTLCIVKKLKNYINMRKKVAI